jgi:hypothetical protein
VLYHRKPAITKFWIEINGINHSHLPTPSRLAQNRTFNLYRILVVYLWIRPDVYQLVPIRARDVNVHYPTSRRRRRRRRRRTRPTPPQASKRAVGKVEGSPSWRVSHGRTTPPTPPILAGWPGRATSSESHYSMCPEWCDWPDSHPLLRSGSM